MKYIDAMLVTSLFTKSLLKVIFLDYSNLPGLT